MKLALPVKNIFVNQPFGVNYVGFYKKLGMKGHNGIDFKAEIGCPVYAAHGGTITYAGEDRSGGISVTITESLTGDSFKTIYYHLSKVLVQKGQPIGVGDKIGLSGNTGKYTTGPHLHFGLKMLKNGKTTNKYNGYFGAINPAHFFKKNWDKSASYHRYGRKANYWREFKMRFKNPWLHRQLYKRGQINKIYSNEFINALVYGGWGYKDVINPSLYVSGWGWLKKDEFIKGVRPFK